jgi:membrane protein DedA with SNARE-associated domain
LKSFIAGIGQRLLSWGPWGAFVLSILDSAGIPVPEGVDLLLITMAAYSAVAGYFGAALAVAGSVVGNVILYYIGRKGGHELLEKRTQKGWPRRFRRWFHHYGAITIFFPVMIPAPLPVKIFVLSAGATDMNLAHFVMLVLVARFVRYFGLAYLGAEFGRQTPWDFIRTKTPLLVAVTVGLIALSFIFIRIKDRRRRREAQQMTPPEQR